MSWTLRARVADWPSFAEARRGFGSPDLVSAPPVPDEGAWPEGLIRFHRREVSTRSVEVAREADRLMISIPACASAADHELAFAILEAIVRDPLADVDAERRGVQALAALRTDYSIVEFEEMARDQAATMARVVESKGPLTMEGPVRSYTLGPRVLSRLSAAGSEEDLPARILVDILRVQWGPEGRGRFDPSIFVADPRREGGGLRIAFWSRGQDLVLPGHAQMYVFEHQDSSGTSSFVAVRREQVPEVAADLFVGYLDESAAIVNAADGAEWDALLARARARGSDLKSVLPPTQKPRSRPWWRFWG